MAQHKSAKKRVRTSEKRRQRNKTYRTKMKTYVKKVKTSTDKNAAGIALKEAQSVIDKLATKGLIPKNTAANKKSKLSRYVNAMT